MTKTLFDLVAWVIKAVRIRYCQLYAIQSLHTTSNRRFHGDVIRRVTWSSGTTGWQKIFGGLDSCFVYINFAHTQDHDYVLYLCGVPLALCGRLVSICYHQKKWKTKKTLVECGQKLQL